MISLKKKFESYEKSYQDYVDAKDKELEEANKKIASLTDKYEKDIKRPKGQETKDENKTNPMISLKKKFDSY